MNEGRVARRAARGRAVRAGVLMFGVVAGCAAGGPPRPESARRADHAPADEARAAAWARIASDAARRAAAACARYSRTSFYAAHAGRFEPALHGPCADPSAAAAMVRIADLALVAAHDARIGDDAAEESARETIERIARGAHAGAEIARVLASLEVVSAVVADAPDCDDASDAVARDLESLAVDAISEALAACPDDRVSVASSATPYLVPGSRCGERGEAQVHATAAHALLLAAADRASDESRRVLAWLHGWLGEAVARGETDPPAYARSLLRIEAAIEGVRRCEATGAAIDARWREHAARRRVPGTGITLLVPEGARLAHGAVELESAIGVRVELAAAGPEEVLATVAGAAARTERRGPGRFLVRRSAPRGASGILVVIDLGDATAVLSAAHFLPVAAGVWDRVAELLFTAERAPETPAFRPEELGFRFARRAPLPFVSFEPGRVRFASAPVGNAPASFTAELRDGAVLPAERAELCEPDAALAIARRGDARVVLRGDRPLAGAHGCEVAATSSGPDGARFEYAALAFLPDRHAEIRVAHLAPSGPLDASALLARARAFADSFELVEPDAPAGGDALPPRPSATLDYTRPLECSSSCSPPSSSSPSTSPPAASDRSAREVASSARSE